MRLFLFLFFLGLSTQAWAQSLPSSAGPLNVEKMGGGLKVPWAMAFLPDGSWLVTERRGRLYLVRDGQKQRVSGLPDVYARGQGGLLDVMVPRDFAGSREVFLTFAKAQTQGAATAVMSGRLSADGRTLQNVRVIFEASGGNSGGRHFGSRIVEGRDGTLFVTIGDRGDRETAQDLSRHNGSVVRINRDGSVPADNPFAGRSDARPEIWSYGHRNPQGAMLDASGRLWTVEHGAKGGDEINRVRRGANFGWPVISYGRHYSGQKIGEGTAKPGMEQPAFYWDPSIAPSGMLIYSGKLWPNWRGHFFVGSLKFGLISRIGGSPLKEAERIEGPQTGRVRDVVEAPDGSIWFLSEKAGAAFRLTPG